MSEILTDDEIRISLRRQGCPDVAIERTIRARHRVPSVGAPTRAVLEMPPRPRAAIVWPLTLRLPWSTLISDNDKHRAMLRGDQAIMVIRRPYRDAGERIHQLALSKVAGAQAAAEPLQVIARVWFPDNNVRDMTNWSKLVFDSLAGAVYENDRWLHDVRWIRMGVDVDQPRAEITISPMSR